jgi:hypothetical protein
MVDVKLKSEPKGRDVEQVFLAGESSQLLSIQILIP